MSPVEISILILGGVAVLGLVMRTLGRSTENAGAADDTSVRDSVDALLDEASAGSEVAALSSDGVAFVPVGESVHLMPPADSGDVIPSRPGGSSGQRLDSGDLIGARVVRGAPDFDPWRLETLGRDAEYMAWPFETEEAAHAARDLFESRIVRVPEDEDGNPKPPSAGDFEEARRRDEETERALDQPDPME